MCGTAMLKSSATPFQKIQSSSALLAEHITSQEQNNKKFAFSVVSCMPFLPRNTISEQKIGNEINNTKGVPMGGGGGRPGCSSPSLQIQIKHNKDFADKLIPNVYMI
jgi:hypothetical protein